MVLGAVGVGALQYYGVPAVRWLCVAIAAAMCVEYVLKIPKMRGNVFAHAFFGCLLGLTLVAAYFVGGNIWMILMLLATIACTDIGAWAFGRLIGGDKMWEHLSAGKTWAGQIAGVICGAIACVVTASFVAGSFQPRLILTGIAVALLSQYGDLTASWIKRKLGIKDFGNLIPGHGGIIDRFDGWIYILPIVWLFMI